MNKIAAFSELFGLQFEDQRVFATKIFMQCGLTQENAEALLPTPTT